MRVTVFVILTIRFVMTLVVADEILQGETVMRTSVLNGCPGMTRPLLKDFA